MAAKLQCEICGGKLIGKPGGIFECDSCGMEYSTAWAKEKIQEITGTVKVEGTVEVTGKVQVDSSSSKDTLLQRGNLALEDGNWDRAKDFFNRALDLDAQCAEAYLGLAMAEIPCKGKENLINEYSKDSRDLPYKSIQNITRARQFDSELEKMFSQLDEKRQKKSKQTNDRLSSIRGKLQVVSGIIAAGDGFILGVRSDGTVLATGDNSYGQCDVSSWENILAVAAGIQHSIGLCANGSVLVAGDCVESEIYSWNQISAISVNGLHTVALRKDRSVLDTDSECIVSGWRVTAIAAGDAHTVGLNTNGTVIATCDDEFLECDVESMSNIIAISANNDSTIGLRADGTVEVSGGLKTVIHDHVCYDRDFSEWNDIVSIAAGDIGLIGLKADGTVISTVDLLDLSDWQSIVAIAAGKGFVGVKSDGTVLSEGWHDLKGQNQCDVSSWKLFNSFDTIEAERKAAEEKREAERKAKNEALKKEQLALQTELANLRGLFTGKRRREIETRLAEINAELKKLQ